MVFLKQYKSLVIAAEMLYFSVSSTNEVISCLAFQGQSKMDRHLAEHKTKKGEKYKRS